MPTPWQDVPKKEYPKFSGDKQTDIVIVGGGLTGICTAYLLSRTGRKIIVLESDTLGGWATIDTTAFVTQIIDTDTFELVELFGEDAAKNVWWSHGEAMDLLQQIIEAEGIECEFERCRAHIYANDEAEFETIQKEADCLKKLQLPHEWRHSKFVFSKFDYLDIPNQAKFHPTKFLYRLADIVSGRGVEIYEHSEALRADETKVETKDGHIEAKQMVVASYYPFNNPKITHFKKGMYRSYAFEVRIPKDLLAPGLYWDNHNPYHYFRIDSGADYNRMIIGGEDHRDEFKIDKDKSWQALEEYLRKIVPKDYEIMKKWSGPILEPSDGLALIGEYEPNQYVATAFSGNGMTYSLIAARLICDLIENQANPYVKLYDPKRKLISKRLWKKGVDYTEEFFGAAVKNLFRKT